jgi:hypothetical protein
MDSSLFKFFLFAIIVQCCYSAGADSTNNKSNSSTTILKDIIKEQQTVSDVEKQQKQRQHHQEQQEQQQQQQGPASYVDKTKNKKNSNLSPTFLQDIIKEQQTVSDFEKQEQQQHGPESYLDKVITSTSTKNSESEDHAKNSKMAPKKGAINEAAKLNINDVTTVAEVGKKINTQFRVKHFFDEYLVRKVVHFVGTYHLYKRITENFLLCKKGIQTAHSTSTQKSGLISGTFTGFKQSRRDKEEEEIKERKRKSCGSQG